MTVPQSPMLLAAVAACLACALAVPLELELARDPLPQLQEPAGGDNGVHASGGIPRGLRFCCGDGTAGGACHDSDLSAMTLAFDAARTALNISTTIDGSAFSCPAESIKVRANPGCARRLTELAQMNSQ